MIEDDILELEVPDAPVILGLRFRHFRGESDYPAMVTINQESGVEDHTEETATVEDIRLWFSHLTNCDPYKDMLFVVVDGDVIGYTMVWWSEDPNNNVFYEHFANLLPKWRGKGLRHAMVRYNEMRLREIGSNHPKDKNRYFRTVAMETEVHWMSVLIDEGYDVMRHGVMMVRPNLDNIPDLPLPVGIEVRPVQPEHYPKILSTWNEACKDMRGQIPLSEEDFKEFRESPEFDPSLWQIAWCRDEVIGTVMCFINEAENKTLNRKRGHTEFISVARPWRNQGIAKALIARGLRALKEKGMTDAALGVDEENPSGAFHLYRKMGFEPVKKVAFYWKPFR